MVLAQKITNNDYNFWQINQKTEYSHFYAEVYVCVKNLAYTNEINMVR